MSHASVPGTKTEAIINMQADKQITYFSFLLLFVVVNKSLTTLL